MVRRRYMVLPHKQGQTRGTASNHHHRDHQPTALPSQADQESRSRPDPESLIASSHWFRSLKRNAVVEPEIDSCFAAQPQLSQARALRFGGQHPATSNRVCHSRPQLPSIASHLLLFVVVIVLCMLCSAGTGSLIYSIILLFRLCAIVRAMLMRPSHNLRHSLLPVSLSPSPYNNK